jgi:hypothetical protein
MHEASLYSLNLLFQELSAQIVTFFPIMQLPTEMHWRPPETRRYNRGLRLAVGAAPCKREAASGKMLGIFRPYSPRNR